jgi:hypothetical protein
MKTPVYRCPSEVNSQDRIDGTIIWFPINYGANVGAWFVYDPALKRGGDGAFAANGKHGFNGFTDGASNTVCFAEVKTFQPYLRESGNPSTANVPIPADAATVVGYGGNFKPDSGHTEWADARSHQAGVTGVFTPNSKVPYTTGGQAYDIDFTSVREGTSSTGMTYAAVTSRSYHPGIVNAVLMDGSVRSISGQIALPVWRALMTRSGGEPISDF